MKKYAFVLGALLLGNAAMAQEPVKNKDGVTVTPEAGDWGVGFDAAPVLGFIGDIFNNNATGDSPIMGFINNQQTLTGKYFLRNDLAVRGALRIGFTSDKMSMYVSDDLDTASYAWPDNPLGATVEDTYASNMFNLGLSGGLEWRKGKGRIQGYYGGELAIWMSSASEKYTYGNAMGDTTISGTSTTNPTYNDWGTGHALGGSARVTEFNSGMTFGVGVRGFVGVEWFFAPKVSIGAEYGWGIGFQSTGDGTATVEENRLDTRTMSTVTSTYEVEMAGSSSFGVDTDINGSQFGTASLKLTFHF